ncbi:MAG TPA: hypothetical protein VHG70_16815 [Nocardioidaceae bacterium]|jgi:hypothetical protein|nr:hypothetical protein [Nocardioidaceae bacterium]
MQSSTHTTVAGVREALLRLNQAAERLRAEYGDTLGVRRLTSDVQRLSADLDELGDPQPGYRPRPSLEELEEIPDREYDASMWSDADQEGFGAPDRHAP